MNISLCKKSIFKNIHRCDIYQPQENGFSKDEEEKSNAKLSFELQLILYFISRKNEEEKEDEANITKIINLLNLHNGYISICYIIF